MAAPTSATPLTPKPERSCSSWLTGCFCADPWTQPAECLGASAGTAGMVYGIVTANPTLAVLSGVAAATNCCAMGRMDCLGDTIQLNHSTDALNRTVTDLTKANADQDREVRQLQENSAKLRSDLEAAHKESAEIHRQHQANLKLIDELNGKIDDLQKRYMAAQETCRNIQKTLADAESAQSHEIAAAGTEMHEDETQFYKNLPQLVKGVADLKAAAEKNAAENTRLAQLVKDLKQEEDSLQTQIAKLQKEKADIERLVQAEQSESAIQEKIRQGTEQLKAIESRLAEIAPRLQELMAASVPQ